ncbi:alpha-N-arabinofuranosidase [Tessaracoccus sp. ZS01]|uniref:alpha-N-arabinofuranosidase n=1 Tax=Tessaracoccus sp. ZS01 TaxID=1906324 RepID=UPI00096C7C33|nr:alpha-L-arabinofuranosidase C-terminal domain-containing protein [Tessaracoccus sp. ZS01]MCG6566653.1 alpha-N-arabinofuranosidase [Tessaracoccus sp. ZS01]OMG59073.1 alpha-N-arabinofuranosidase [Tessaracoccus sp. ZS01]
MSTIKAVINLDLPGPVISRHIYGHFAEHLGRCIYGGFWVGEDSSIPNTRGIRQDVVDALRALKIPNLRWPGGCFADYYHWRDGIGVRHERPRMVNAHWGDVVEDNSFGTHEFMDLCEMLGSDAYINGNVGSGTVQEMSDWVEYLTRDDDSPMAKLRRQNGREEAWDVPFWGIGNEAWGCGGNMRAQAYADLARQYSTFLRNHGDNHLYRIAAGANEDDYAWTEELMKALGCVSCSNGSNLPFQAISLHNYTRTGDRSAPGHATQFGEDEWYLALARARHMDVLIKRHSTVMDRYDPGQQVGLVVDEWGTWWEVEEGTHPGFLYQQNTLRDALVASVHLDIFHQHADRVVMANIAQTVNVLQAMLLTDAESGALVLTPTYHVFEMGVGHHDAAALDVHFPTKLPTVRSDGTELPLISASASIRGAEALLSLSNLSHVDSQSLSLDLRGRAVRGWSARILTAESLNGHNTPEAPAAVSPRSFDGIQPCQGGLSVELPPHSYVTVALELDDERD